MDLSDAGIFSLIFIVGILLTYVFVRRHFSKKLEDFEKRSAGSQRGSIRGKMFEQIAPLLPEFKYDPSDARFIGSPLDYVIFNGMSGNRDGIATGPIEIIFMDAKTGSG